MIGATLAILLQMQGVAYAPPPQFANFTPSGETSPRRRTQRRRVKLPDPYGNAREAWKRRQYRCAREHRNCMMEREPRYTDDLPTPQAR